MRNGIRVGFVPLFSALLLVGGCGSGGNNDVGDTFTIGGTVTGLKGSGLTLQNNGGDDLAISADGAFTFSTALDDTSDYEVTVLSEPEVPPQACTVSNGSGTVTSANVSDVSVTCQGPFARFVYTANSSDDSVSSYAIGVYGGLHYIGKVAAGDDPQSVAIHPTGRYAYVANFLSDNVSQYAVGADGNLTPMGTPASAGAAPISVAVHPTGRYAYVANAGELKVSQYTIGTSGRLSPMNPDSALSGLGPRSVAVDPSGRYAYVANIQGDSVSQYTIATDGSLAPMGNRDVSAGLGPVSAAVDPSGRYVYVVNYNDESISQYSIDAADGALRPMAPRTVPLPGLKPRSITVDPSGQYVLVANESGGSLPGPGSMSMLNVSASGTLQLATIDDPISPTAPRAIIFDASRRLYIADAAGGVWQRSFIAPNAIGGLFANPDRLTGPAGAVSIAVSVGRAPAKLVPRYAYVANQNPGSGGTVSQYAIEADGRLEPLSTPSVAAGMGAISVAVTPSGRHAYVANRNDNSNNVSQYTVDIGGGLMTNTPATMAAEDTSVSLALDPSGRYAYVTNNDYLPTSIGSGGNVSQYTIGGNGSLTPITAAATVAAGDLPTFITVDPSGRYVYVANLGSGNVSQFAIDANGGLVLVTTPEAAGASPNSVAVDPSGLRVYVTNGVNDAIGTVSQYFISGTGGINAGSLLPMSPATVEAGMDPRSITVHPSGSYAYVANFGAVGSGVGGSVSQYDVDGPTGALTPMSPTAAVPSGGRGPVFVTADPTGRYVYVTNSVSDTVSRFAVGPDGGLTLILPDTPAGIFPSSIAIWGSYE